jgi:hypothetical protein
VRYVGVRDPLLVDRAGVMAQIDGGLMSVADLDDFNARRLGGPKKGGGYFPVMAAIPGLTTRSLGPAEGLSRTYVWGPAPWTFVQDVSAADWAAIQALPEAAHFAVEEQ